MSNVISGASVWTPPRQITNAGLMASYNAHADRCNAEHAAEIASGRRDATPRSSVEFIGRASGIKARWPYVKDGILDIDCMHPRIPRRREDELSHQAEMGLAAARGALLAAGKTATDIDMIIVSCAYTERAYPAIAIEIQHALGVDGCGFDMRAACSAATFALHRAHDALAGGSATGVLVINPELTSPQVNYGDRDSHFIFGDVATAVVMERADTAVAAHQYRIVGAKAVARFSNNIRSNFGYVARAEGGDPFDADRLFH